MIGYKRDCLVGGYLEVSLWTKTGERAAVYFENYKKKMGYVGKTERV